MDFDGELEVAVMLLRNVEAVHALTYVLRFRFFSVAPCSVR